jgi:hypothetical protein
MPREIPRPKRIDGKIRFMPSDGFFLAARDIKDYVPLKVRILEVVEYPAGTPRGGHSSKEPFTAIVFEVPGPKGWRRYSKPWAPNITALWALFNRFGENSEWWAGQEITLNLTPRRSPNGGGVVAGVYVVPLEDERTEEQVAKKMARALAHECPYQAPEREPGADEDEPADDFDQRTDDDTTEPPEGWQPGEQP